MRCFVLTLGVQFSQQLRLGARPGQICRGVSHDWVLGILLCFLRCVPSCASGSLDVVPPMADADPNVRLAKGADMATSRKGAVCVSMFHIILLEGLVCSVVALQ